MQTRFPFSNGHVQTMFPVLFRSHPHVEYVRERIETPDGDFLDLDWCGQGSDTLVIVLHGLEGHARRKYVQGMVRTMATRGWDCLAMNYRGCSGVINRNLRLYHLGATDDVRTVIEHVLNTNGYARVGLVGFSMGGNLILKYLGEAPDLVPEQVRVAAAFSVPCDLVGASRVLDKRSNAVYMQYFLKGLREKVRQKHAQFPQSVDLKGLDKITTFGEFDERYTAPIHGFASAMDYWQKSGSGQYLPEVRVPSLVVNAANDPFLSQTCFPYEEAYNNDAIHLEVPKTGGHVGFVSFKRNGRYWSEQRALDFFTQYLGEC